MSSKTSFAAVLFSLGFASTPVFASVTNIGTLDVGNYTFISTATNGSFTNYIEFSVEIPFTISVSTSDTVKPPAQLITGGTLSLYTCASDCDGSVVPVLGALQASDAFYNLTTTVQVAGFGPIDLAMGDYVIELSGTSPGTASVKIAGTETISAVPEPSTWAMMLIGFAGCGFLATRKNRARLNPLLVLSRG